MKNHERKLSYLGFDDICIVNQIPTCNTSVVISIETKASTSIH